MMIMDNKEKILSKERVKELGLDKLEVITSDMLEGYTIIGYDAFRNCSSIRSITLPKSITIIPNGAFYGCTSLPIENYLRYADTYLAEVVDKSLSAYIIKNGTKWIKDWAFYKCSNLKTIIIPNSVISIGRGAFYDCFSITSITIPKSIKSIEEWAFCSCDKLRSVRIGNKTYEMQTIENGKCKAYKAFKADLTCIGFQYEEGKTYEYEGEPILREQGFHACLNLTDVFNYYFGEFGKDIVVHEVELEGISDERSESYSMVAAKKITIGKRIL